MAESRVAPARRMKTIQDCAETRRWTGRPRAPAPQRSSSRSSPRLGSVRRPRSRLPCGGFPAPAGRRAAGKASGGGARGGDRVEGDAPLAGEVATDNTAEMRAGKMSGRGFHRRASRCRCATSGTSGGPGAGGSCRGGVAGAEMAGTEAAVAFRVCRGARPGGGWVRAARSRGSRVCARTSRLLPY